MDLTSGQYNIVTDILNQYIPGSECMAFSSRTTGSAKSYSDLDIVIINDNPLDFSTLGELQEAFAESDLPFRVDLLQWSRINEDFKKTITPQLQKIC